MLQIIQEPKEPILAQQKFLVSGVASPTYAGKRLDLLIDDRFKGTGPAVQVDGTWSLQLLFQQAGNRRLRISVGTESAEITVQIINASASPPIQPPPVVPVPTPPLSGRKLQITEFPTTSILTKQPFTLAGKAQGYADGDLLTLYIDRYQVSRPRVQQEKWQSRILIQNPGQRIVAIIGQALDQAQATITVVVSRPPRLKFTQIPQLIQAATAFTVTGEAEGYDDGDQVVLTADGYELARTIIQSGKWQATSKIFYPGKRVLMVVGSEQDRAQTSITVQSVADIEVLPRNLWTPTQTPSSLPDLRPKLITLHHTAISPTLSAQEPQSLELERMRLLQRIHVQGNGWSDIGYHFIVMPSGRIYEARSELKRGAHDVINDGLGIAFDGIYTSTNITQKQFESAVALCTLLFRRYELPDPMIPVPTVTADYGIRNLPPIIGHRDRVQTECPGANGGQTVRLDEIRRTVKTNL